VLISAEGGTRVRLSGHVTRQLNDFTPEVYQTTKERWPAFWAIFERVAAALPPRP